MSHSSDPAYHNHCDHHYDHTPELQPQCVRTVGHDAVLLTAFRWVSLGQWKLCYCNSLCYGGTQQSNRIRCISLRLSDEMFGQSKVCCHLHNEFERDLLMHRLKCYSSERGKYQSIRELVGISFDHNSLRIYW